MKTLVWVSRTEWWGRVPRAGHSHTLAKQVAGMIFPSCTIPGSWDATLTLEFSCNSHSEMLPQTPQEPC